MAERYLSVDDSLDTSLPEHPHAQINRYAVKLVAKYRGIQEGRFDISHL